MYIVMIDHFKNTAVLGSNYRFAVLAYIPTGTEITKYGDIMMHEETYIYNDLPAAIDKMNSINDPEYDSNF